LSSVAIAVTSAKFGKIIVFTQNTDLKAAKKLIWAGHGMMALIVLGSILPLDWCIAGLLRWPTLFKWRDMQLQDVLQNIAALVPVGIVYGASRDSETRWRSFIIACIITIVLQLIQLFLPGRVPRLTDSAANILGLLIGLYFARATHAMRVIPSAPQPIELAILLLLFCYIVLLLLIDHGAASITDTWLLRTEMLASNRILPAAKFLIAGFVLRALVAEHSRIIWLALLFCAACLLLIGAAVSWRLSVALLIGGLMAQFITRRWSIVFSILALTAVLLWDGLTPWIVFDRAMNWMPLKSLLFNSSMMAFVSLAWKLFCWSSLALLLCHFLKHGRTIVLSVGILVAVIEWTQTYIGSGFPDITDIILAAGISGLVVLAVQQTNQHVGYIK
jgi:glycopeptide antibiotics resistance protein